MATYSNQHWLLSHIRNSFISTDDTGMCETVMASDDLAKHYLQKFQTATLLNGQTTFHHHNQEQQQAKSNSSTSSGGSSSRSQRTLDPPLTDTDFVCYPGLDQSDDEEMDLSSQSYDIQMYPEVGAYRFRSNTAQKLEKMDIARRKAARTKCVNFEETVVPPENNDDLVMKPVVINIPHGIPYTDLLDNNEQESNVTSKLAIQLINSPKQTQNKFMEFARFDGTSQTGIQTKRINVYLAMLPGRERNYPIKICVLANAKILDVIGLICYKATMQYPDIPLKSIRNYGLYMTEDNDDMEDFPPLDNREPCSKFGFSHLTLAERRPLAPVTRVDYHNNHATKSMTSEEDKARLAAAAVRSLQGIDFNGSGTAAGLGVDAEEHSNDLASGIGDEHLHDLEELHSQNDVLEAPVYRTYRLNMIDKRFFKTEVTLGISGERIEIDQHKHMKFWTKQKAVTYPIDSVAYCEILERRSLKAIMRFWLKAPTSSSSNTSATGDGKSSSHATDSIANLSSQSPTSPSHYSQSSSPFAFFSSSSPSSSNHHHMRFKHYDFEADLYTAEQILNKINYLLRVRSSEARREFLHIRERKLEKVQAKKHLKM